MPDYLTGSAFIRQAVQTVLSKIDSDNFSGSNLSDALRLSREQTHRRIKAQTGLSTGRFVRYLRLLMAYHYLTTEHCSVAEVSYKVGFDSPTYFNRCFKQAFGLTPGAVRKNSLQPLGGNLEIVKFYRRPAVNTVFRQSGSNLNLPVIEPGTHLSQPPKRLALMIAIILLVIPCALLFFGRKSKPSFIFSGDVIAVIPFKNHSSDSTLDVIGHIASNWIAAQLNEIGSIKTVPYFTTQQYEDFLGIVPEDPHDRPTFAEVTGAKHLIHGHFFLEQDQLNFDTYLLDAHTQETIYQLPLVSGSIDSVMPIIEAMRSKLAGLILGIREVEVGKLTPPNYEAYTYYLEGVKEMRNGYSSRALKLFQMATDSEPNFVMPQLYQTWYLYGDARDSVFKTVADIPKMTEYEKRRFNELRLFFDRQYRAALEVALKALVDYPQDYYFNMRAAHGAKSQFMPELALKILQRLHDPLRSNMGLMWHYYKILNYTDALWTQGEYQAAREYLESIPHEFFNVSIPELLIITYTRLGESVDFIDQVIQRHAGNDVRLFADYNAIAANEHYLVDDTVYTNYFADKAINYLMQLESPKGYQFDLLDLYFLKGQLIEAKAFILEADSIGAVERQVLIGLIEAALGRETSALKIADNLVSHNIILLRRNPVEYQTDYILARIHAQLGHETKAIDLLQSAWAKGQIYHHNDFHRDIYLKPLFRHPAFQELVKPITDYAVVTGMIQMQLSDN